MIIHISKWLLTLFGLFIIFTGFLMLFYPKKAQSTLRKFASTNLINYTEITLRLLVATAMILYADFCKLPEAFTIFGWFLLITALILYAVPRKLHHTFSTKSAHILKPFYFRLISPFAFLFGLLILYNLKWFSL